VLILIVMMETVALTYRQMALVPFHVRTALEMTATAGKAGSVMAGVMMVHTVSILIVMILTVITVTV
jgi:hypothetical protein